MQRYSKSDMRMALILLAPVIVVYGVLFIYPTIQMIILTFQKAPPDRAGRMGRLQELHPAVWRQAVQHRRLEYLLFRAADGDPVNPVGTGHCLGRQPAKRRGAKHSFSGLLCALYPASRGGLPDLGLDAGQSVWHHAIPDCRDPGAKMFRYFARCRCSCLPSPSSPPGGRRGSMCCCSSPVCAISVRKSMRPPNWTAQPGGRCLPGSPGRWTGRSPCWWPSGWNWPWVRGA